MAAARRARVVWVDSARTHAWNEAEAAALADTTRARLIRRDLDESFYYNTRYGSPLAYLRPLELLAQHGSRASRGNGSWTSATGRSGT